MPVYLQIILIVAAFIAFYVLALLLGGLGIRRLCFKIIAEMEEAKAFSAAQAIGLPEGRRNFFRVGTGNLRPKALNVLIAEGLVVKAGGGKFYLNRERLSDMKNKLRS
ncbi:MAG: hypothetical protein JW943_06500 [Deltaproteobacteria bacterium]|nr:hypothetical protein [Deltaproteobacteria bacterium]